MFVSVGVYYVMAETGMADTEMYSLSIMFEPKTYVELKINDISALVMRMELNTRYSATPSSAKDADFFSFALDVDSAVDVTLSGPRNGARSDCLHAHCIPRR